MSAAPIFHAEILRMEMVLSKLSSRGNYRLPLQERDFCEVEEASFQAFRDARDEMVAEFIAKMRQLVEDRFRNTEAAIQAVQETLNPLEVVAYE